MNQSTRRKPRHLLHVLITLVVIGSQIALPLGALVAALQPTPQITQAAVQQAGLGTWFAQRVSDLTAWAQPLWGQPKRAAAQTAAPGGVTANLAAWYKADGTVGATQWNDESGNGKHMLAAGNGTAASMPTLDATPGAANNFNPRVAFLSNADASRKWTMTASGNNVFANTSTPGTIFNVSSFPDETLYDVPQMYAFEDDDPGLNLVTDRNATNDIRVIFQRDNGGTGWAGWDFNAPGFSQVQPLLTAHAWNYAAGGNTFTFNGYDYTPSTNVFLGATSPRYIFGAELTNGGGEAHSGYTSENIVYSVDWPSNSSERKRINSYLAIKYGVTLLGTGALAGGAADATFGGTADYLDSASTIIWSGTTTNSSYHNNVAGIGRDDASALNQKQSISTNPGFQPVIGLGTIAAGNAANSNAFAADKSFLVWGNNNGAASYGVSYTPSSFTPVAGYFRMNRAWKVQETGSVGNVVVQATGADHLLVSSDPTFASGVTEIAMSSGSATVDFSNGQFFTFGVNATAPGGVGTGLETWVKADAGISASDGGAIGTWTDQSLGGYDFTQATGSAQPTYYSTTADKLLNFNPVVDFDGTGDYLRNTNVLMPSSSPYTFLAVGVDEDTGTGYRKIFGSEGIVDYFGLYKQGGATGDNGWVPYAIGGQARSAPFIGDRGSMGKGTKYSAVGGANGYWNGTNFTSDSRTQYTQPQIVGFNSLNSATSDPFYTWTDGYKEDPNWSPIVDGLTFRNQFFTQTSIGADVTVELWKGRIPEFIAYSQSLSDSDIAKINSYLALKYGITLGQGNGHVGKNGNNYNYVATDGTVIWSAATNSVYAYNIAGIGRDDAEALNQKQSKSIQAGFQPVIGVGAIAATNAANNHAFAANKSYLVWGDNGQTASFGTAYTPNSFTPAAGYYRMSRVWKVQETGTITNVVVQAANADHLLVSSDPTFASGVTEIAFNSGSAIVDFTNGQFFTFGKNVTAPGGIPAGLGLWLKADQGTSTTSDGAAVSAWEDASLSNSDVLQATANLQPLYTASGMNFNPALNFSTDALWKDDGTSAIPNQSDPVTIVSVTTNRTTGGGFKQVVSFSGGADWPSMHWSDQQVDMYIDDTTNVWNRHTTLVPINTPTIANGRANNASPKDVRVSFNGRANEQTFTGADGTFPAASGTADLVIGAETPGGGEPMDGLLTEAIVYNRFLSDSELMQVNSYLALKYGITLIQTTPTNYVDSAGGAIWDATANATYSNDIAGIGRDDASALNQKQSKSVNGDDPVTISLGTPAATNAANNKSFAANKSFLLWGNNNGATTYGVSYAPSSFTPVAGYYHMNRVWKVQETGTITNVVVQATGAEHLLVSSDPTFATGVTEIAMSSGQVTVNFTNGQYFTFGKTQIAPGGVVTDLAFWYKPEAGVTLSSDKVSSWVDQANGIEVIPAAANNGPTYYDSGPDLMNFNPVLNFTNATRQDGLRAASGLPAIPNGVSTFSVLSPADASNRWFLHWGVFGAGYYNNYGHCNANNPGVWTNSHGGCVNNPTTLGPITTPSFLSVRWNSTAGTNQWQLRRNGQLHSGTTTSTALNVPADTALEIGDVNNRTAGNEYIGNIAEVIGYTARLGDTDRQKVESYLAIKYGITYMNDGNTAATDYLNSAGAKVWDATANSAYAAAIAGIGRDDASALQQKQSMSVNGGFQPTIGLGTIATSNAANNSTFAANMSFLLWGSNNAATTLTANYNGGSNNRLARVWKVQETGTVGAVKVVIPRSAFPTVGLRSLIVHSSDATFGTVDRTYPLVSTGGNYEVTVDFNSGDFFTFSSSFTIPEINVTPGTLDFGEVNTGMVSPAQAVTIQNQGEVNLSLSNISLSGTDAARFAISSNNCGASLSAGASCTVQLTFAPTTAGSRSALLVITSNDSDEGTVNVALSGRTPGSSGGGTSGAYNLAVTKSASTANATVGVPFTYTITVFNKGTIAASNVTMTDQLPVGVTFGSANATGGGNCTHNSGTVTCTWASLLGGATATVTISVTP